MSRKALLEKIKALLAKTVANGCTEAEALAALEKARAMMAEHEVTEADLSFGGEEVRAQAKRQEDRDRTRLFLAPAVGDFCGCKSWSGGGRDNIIFCGLESDTVFAHWLLDMLGDFVARELKAYLRATWKPGMPTVRRVESNGFVLGCVGRIVQRLRELTPKPPRGGQGRGLVVARNALIDAYLRGRSITLRRDRHRTGASDNGAYGAGIAAGDHAQFNKPVNAGGPVLAIGTQEEW